VGAARSPIRIAAIGDVHGSEETRGRLRYELEPVNQQADVLVLAGDLTLNGWGEEARLLAQELRGVRIPIVAVLGNHDFEKNENAIIAQTMRQHGVRMLEDGPVAVTCQGQRVGFAGAKGFCGGFGDRLVAPFGEPALKAFVRVGQQEAEWLDQGLGALRQDPAVKYVVAVLHYAPIRETVVGEPPELWPYLGNSSLSAPLDRHGVDVAFHGHAHYGSPFGRTAAGVPVYNVAQPLVRAFVIHELAAAPARVPVG
jgi:Icc-related predicted phosphoesterase